MKPIRMALMGLACWVLAGPMLCSAQTVRVRSRNVSPPAKSAQTPSERPAWKDVEKSVQAVFAKLKDYEPGDLITKEEAAPVFSALKKIGWEVKQVKELSDRMLPSSDELVRQLRGKRGRKFMREVGDVAGAFDRLDRLRKLPRGPQRVRELIEQPQGYKLIEYMATTPGGKRMGRQLSSKKRGDFNAPTQRIYTEQMLLSELKAIYQTEQQAMSK